MFAIDISPVMGRVFLLFFFCSGLILGMLFLLLVQVLSFLFLYIRIGEKFSAYNATLPQSCRQLRIFVIDNFEWIRDALPVEKRYD